MIIFNPGELVTHRHHREAMGIVVSVIPGDSAFTSRSGLKPKRDARYFILWNLGTLREHTERHMDDIIGVS